MKIASIQPLTLSDFPPYCAAIIFTIGCNLRCSYCHNKSLWDENYRQISSQEVFDFLAIKKNKLDGVVITGGEPTIHGDLVLFIKMVKILGYKIKLNTNGTNFKSLRELIDQNLIDYIAMDIKAPFTSYTKICGSNIPVNEIKKSLKLIMASSMPHEFRTVWDKKLLNEEEIETIKSYIPKGCKHILIQL